MPHEAPDDGGCTGWGCIGCLALYIVAILSMLWLIQAFRTGPDLALDFVIQWTYIGC